MMQHPDDENPPVEEPDPEADIDEELAEEEATSESASSGAFGENGPQVEALEAASSIIEASLLRLGYVAFDEGSPDNTTAQLMSSQELRKHFRRDVYVGIRDVEQSTEFLGRVVQGPFHAPHEIGTGSAMARTTVMHPDRTKFRPTYFVTGSIEILGEIRNGERVVPTPTRPRPYSETYIFPAERLKKMLGLHGDFFLGHLMGYEEVEVHADVKNKNFLPRNVGIFGTIGSGKSNTTQVLVEEALKTGWAVVIVDVEGEYVRMNEPNDQAPMTALLHTEFGLEAKGVSDFHVYVPSSGDTEAENPKRFKVPISQMPIEVLADLIDLSEAQMRMFGPLVARAERDAPARGRAAAATNRSMGALGGGASPTAQPQRAYTLQDLVNGLKEDDNFPLLPRPPRGHEVPTAYTLRSKLTGLGMSGMMDWNATDNVDELPVRDLLTAGRLSVLDVSETADRSRNIAIAYTLQSLFEEVITTPRGDPFPGTNTPRPPVLVVIEEVHTFVSRGTVDRMRAVLDQLQIISRRGRKRWMALGLVSQQPGHVPDELFELVNTRFIHQLKSASNLAPVKLTTGGVHEALWGTMPSLGPGQCLLTGAVFHNPVFVSMRPAQSRRLLTS